MSAVFQWSSLRRLDVGMLAAVLALLAGGILFVFSSGYRGPGHPPTALFSRQIAWAAAGMACMVLMAVLDYRRWLGLAWWCYILGLALLIMTLIPGLGVTMYGARRWLDLGFLKVQPAEFAKLAIILVLARFLGSPSRDLKLARHTVIALLLAGVPMLLIMRQPDLGTAQIIPPVTLAMLYVAGVPGRYLRRLLLLGILAVALVLGVCALPQRMGASPQKQDEIARMIGLSPYQRDRLLVFLDSSRDPLDTGWSKAQSQIAIGSGGAWGKGFLQGTQNLLGFLPRTVAPTDFIFSVIAEEMGFAGSLGLLIIFFIVTASGARAALVAKDAPGRLLAVGIMTLWFCHVFINIAMTMGLMPITGIPLPLISYGGSFVMGAMAALGLLQSVYSRGARE